METRRKPRAGPREFRPNLPSAILQKDRRQRARWLEPDVFGAHVEKMRGYVRGQSLDALLQWDGPTVDEDTGEITDAPPVLLDFSDPANPLIDMSGGCPMPFRRKIFACEGISRMSLRERALMIWEERGSASLTVLHPCKKRSCKECADRLFRMWCARAAAEFDKAERSWHVVLTLSLEEHVALAMRVRAKHGLNVSDEKYRQLRGSELWRMVYACLRRVTGKDVAANVRYFAVIEPHDSEKTSVSMRGNPHVHIILNERYVGSLVPPFLADGTESGEWIDDVDRNGEVHRRYRLRDEVPLRQQWPFGHSRITLCLDKGAAMEVAKYLRKNPYGRVKASRHYGAEAADADPPAE